MDWNYVYDFSEIPFPQGEADEAHRVYVALPEGGSEIVGKFQIQKIWNSSAASCECCDRWAVAAWRVRSPIRG